MARLIEVQDARACPARLAIRVDDVLVFAATGGHVRSGTDAVEMLGAFVPGVLGTHGEVLSPAGAPSSVLFRARRAGKAVIDVVTGDPWRAPHATVVELIIDD
jgi:hypothetical protein